ncbi:MAG: VWA domain-containing protein [Candidatus Schekmanbacteria bacterium]|nr:VWA domain-containing protein [Candidatus Schekmanbacteria bacterium]
MKFADVAYFNLLWPVLGLAVFLVYAFRARALLLRKFAAVEVLGKILPAVRPGKQKLKAGLVLAGALFTVIALARPQWGYHWEDVHREGVDIVIAVDVSDSMLAQDVEPNRLERAKREITDLLQMLDGDRVGLIAFAGTAFLECPLTLDYAAMQVFLADLDTDLIPIKGTAISDAIDTAVKALEKSDRQSRAVILITDGEDHEGDPVKAAEDAKLQGVKVFPIGIGKLEGAPIPAADGSGFRKNRRGEVVVTKLDEPTLQKVALITGGTYVRSVSGDLDLEKIYAEGIKQRLETTELESSRQKRWEERFQWFLLLAILALGLEPMISERARRSAAAGRGIAAPVALLAILLALPHDAAALSLQEGEKAYEEERYADALEAFVAAQVEDPGNPDLTFNVGNAHFGMKNYEEAVKAFTDAYTKAEPPLREQCLYNIGNAMYRQGKLEEAINFYQQALDLEPSDEDAKHNLEFAREELKRRINEAKKRQEQQQQNQEQPQQNQEQQQDQQQNQQDGGQQQQGEDQQEDQEKQPEPQPGGEQTPPDEGKEPPEQDEQGEQQQANGDGEAGAEQAREMTQEEAERYLDAMQEDRSKLLEARRQRAGRPRRVEKDW